jgi:hypothetical protein
MNLPSFNLQEVLWSTNQLNTQMDFGLLVFFERICHTS